VSARLSHGPANGGGETAAGQPANGAPMTHRDLSEAHLAALAECYADSFLTLDRLPYTAQFDALCERFRERTGLVLDHHNVWLALCNLRKADRLVRKKR